MASDPVGRNILLAWRADAKTSCCFTESLSSTQAEAEPARPAPRFPRVLLRVVFLILLAFCVGQLFRFSQRLFRRGPVPAGFARGVIHGVLMPIALPSLAFGHDVEIYATENTGRGYKLGYTLGVNGCGAVFFGIVFWRVNRWRRKLDRSRPDSASRASKQPH